MPEAEPADLPTISTIEAAAEQVADGAVRTPCLRSHTLSEVTGAEIWVKFENLQFTGSFKDRGSLVRLLALDDDQRARGVIALSAGNHAQGVAHHAARLGVHATIVMPSTTPYAKVNRTRMMGAEVVLAGRDLAECVATTDRLIAERDLTLIHPYDDPLIISGQGTCGLEIDDDAGPLDDVVVPIGGGGLIGGVALALAERRPEVEIVGVQSERYDAVARSRGRTGPVVTGATLADGIAVKSPGRRNRALIDRLVGDVRTVGEASIERAIALFLDIEKSVAEGAGAASLAAVLEHPERFRGRRVCVILSGGNIDARVLASVLLRDLVRGGRIAHLRIEADDLPGSLADVTRIISDCGADIVEVSHQRLLTELPARRVDIDVMVETRGAEHTASLIDLLRGAGHGVRLRSD
ncbi:MAG: threonine ammonia-lyase [Actinomycetota bacterium]